MKQPRVSIIFPNYNGGNEPIECLRSIEKIDYPKGQIEILVIDNGSTDGSASRIRKTFPQVTVIKNTKNVGFAKAVNQGIHASSGEYVFITNDDIVFGRNSLYQLVKRILNSRTIGAVGAATITKNAKTFTPSAFTFNKWSGNVVPVSSKKVITVDWVSACVMLIPRKIINKIGMFDEKYGPAFFEDVDLCFRIRNNGYDIVYDPAAVFEHGVTKTANKNLSLKHEAWYKNKFRFILKHLPWANVCIIFLLHLLLITRYGIFSDDRFFPAAKGMLWNFLQLTETIKNRNI